MEVLARRSVPKLIFLLHNFCLCLCISNEFHSFKSEFNLTFDCGYKENEAFNRFKENKEKIDDFNGKIKKSSNSSFYLGLWEMSYYGSSEVDKMLNGYRPPIDSMIYEVKERTPYIGSREIGRVPENVTDINWVDLGAVVTRIRTQGEMSSKWQFSADLVAVLRRLCLLLCNRFNWCLGR
jgi:hypothetical protein